MADDPNTSITAALEAALERASRAREAANSAGVWACKARELFDAAAGFRVCGDVDACAALVRCECGHLRQHDRGHGHVRDR